MDTITQGLLGAAIGQAAFGKRLGRGAVVWGAVGGVIPDLDILPSTFMGEIGDMLYHRGPTHALWFGVVLAPICGYGVWRWYKRKAGKAGKPPPGRSDLWWWMALFLAAIVTHPLLDVFTSYGTQLFTPFSNARVAVHGVSIIDPIYSLTLVAALAAGRVWRSKPVVGMAAAGAALVLTTSYLFYGWHLNERAKERARVQLEAEGETVSRVSSYPTFLQVFQRRIVARTAGGEVRVANISMWKDPQPIAWAKFFPPDHPFIDKALHSREGEIFTWFCLEEYVPRVIESGDRVIVKIDDLRYGMDASKVEGIWGLQAVFDRQGRLLSPPARFNRHRPGNMWETLGRMWRDTFG